MICIHGELGPCEMCSEMIEAAQDQSQGTGALPQSVPPAQEEKGKAQEEAEAYADVLFEDRRSMAWQERYRDYLAGARSRGARIKELEAHLEGARNSAGVTALEVENASLRAALEQVKAERDELKVENAEIWAKCPNEEWECTKIQRRLERRIASLEEGLREIANHCEHDQEGPGELCDCSTHMSLRARALLAAGEKAGGENG